MGSSDQRVGGTRRWVIKEAKKKTGTAINVEIFLRERVRIVHRLAGRNRRRLFEEMKKKKIGLEAKLGVMIEQGSNGVPVVRRVLLMCA